MLKFKVASLNKLTVMRRAGGGLSAPANCFVAVS